MEHSIQIMAQRLADILPNSSIYLYGSVVMDDFRHGWSDIDIVCFSDTTPPAELVDLRQHLTDEYAGNTYFRLFEGVIISTDKVVYWGTSGQRIIDTYTLDPFSVISLKTYGRLLHGPDIREGIQYPSRDEIMQAVERHYKTIRAYGKKGAGWLLDTARCLYTISTNDIIAKTQAGEWALDQKLPPDTEAMKRALEIRKNPVDYKDDEETQQWLSSLEPRIQEFADVLEKELYSRGA